MAITLVQSVSGTGTSVSFSSNTTAGNCIVVGFGDQSGATGVTGVTLGASAGHFAQLAQAEGTPSSASVLAALWADPNCAGGQTAISVSVTGTTDVPTIWAAEFSGIATSSPLDKETGTTGTASSWSSGSTATTTQAVELWLGAFCNAQSSSGAGPGSPWTDVNVTDGNGDVQIYGYDIVSATGAASFAGTGGSGKGWAAAVATLKGATGTTPSPFSPPRSARGRPAARRGTGEGSPGAKYVSFPSAFTPPRKPATGRTAAIRGKGAGAAGKYTAPPPIVVSPFTLPTRPAKGQAARRGSSHGEPGAPYIAFPSPFPQPHGPARGAQAARRGGSASSPGARWVLVRISPFPQPHGPARGRSATPVTGRGHGSPGARFVLIQTSPFIPPRKPARGATAARRGIGSAGSATGHGAPVVPRKLLVSIASAAGTDDYGNSIIQGLFAGQGKIQGPQIVATGSGGEYFAYNGPPALGNLILSVAAQAGTDPYGNAYPQGLNVTVGAITGTTITGNDFIINDAGEFFYSGTPGFGNLIASIAGSAGIDGFGNSYQAGLTAYDGSGDYISLGAASITFSNGTTISNYTQPDVAVLLGTLRTTALVVNGTLLNIPLAPPSGPSSAPSSYTQAWGQNITGVLNNIIATLGTAGIW